MVAIIGVLAAVAIPAYMKNVRKTKTVEAQLHIKKMMEGAVSYYNEEANKAGSAVPIARQFPDTPAVATEPAVGSCCSGAVSKCQPNAALWVDPTWQALKFSVDDPHYYSYTYTHNGVSLGSGAAIGPLPDTSTPTEYFFVSANGDLNCDGVYSTFEMLGAITGKGDITTGAGIYKDKELE